MKKNQPYLFLACITSLAYGPLAGAQVLPGSSASGVYYDGFDNTAIGYEVLVSDQGSFALGNLQSGKAQGAANTGAGVETLYSNTVGSYNTGFGTAAMAYNTTGSFNAAFGYSSVWAIPAAPITPAMAT